MSSEENQESKTINDSCICQLEAAVNELYSFRDLFFESHSLDEASKKNDLLKEKLSDTVQLFTEMKCQADKSDKAMYLYLLGRALNVLPDANLEAEESLSKALKLNPGLISAWNELGECFWKRNKTRDAKNCFDNALKHGLNKVSLRSLSITYRDEALSAKSVEERHELTQRGVKMAKRAVEIDADDGTSWAILGNAHLSEFFIILQNPKYLKSALDAYKHAGNDPISRNTPELHYNKGITLKYNEDYEEALEAFAHASALDPTWESASQKLEDLVSYLGKIHELVEKKGKTGTKKLQGMLKTLTTEFLGPYSSTFQGVLLNLVPISTLSVGPNEKKVVLGRVVCHIRSDDGVPFTFCITDKDQVTAAVTVYNLAEGRGVIIGDAVAIPEPVYSQVKVSFRGKDYVFGSIRVDTPIILVVNGKGLSRDCIAGAQLSTFNKPD